MKATFITLNGETVYHHKGRLCTRKRPMNPWLKAAILLGLIDLTSALYLILR